MPGKLHSEGTLIVDAAITTIDTATAHARAREAVVFQVIDSIDGDSARGDYGGFYPGVVRPQLDWRTELQAELPATAALQQSRRREPNERKAQP